MPDETRDPGAPRFHYDREERTASLPEDLQDARGKRNLFKGNRSLLITLIDVAFLVILVVVFSVVSRLLGDNTVLPNYTVSAGATAFGERVLVSVKIQAREDRDVAEAVRIRIGYPGSGDRVELNDFLPAEKGNEEIYRGSLLGDASEQEVRITLYTQSAMGSINTRIKEEEQFSFCPSDNRKNENWLAYDVKNRPFL